MKTILLVDDDVDVLRYLQETLTLMGYKVIAKLDAGPALFVISEGHPVDLVITDYTMPGMDGVTFLTQVRNLAPTVPVVVLSGNDSIESHLRSLALDGFDYIFKPVRTAELSGIVKAALERAISH